MDATPGISESDPLHCLKEKIVLRTNNVKALRSRTHKGE